MSQLIKIELSVIDSEKWKVFQKHFELFDLLVRHDVFEQKSASVTLNFDHEGTLQTIERKDFLYSARFPKLSTG